MTTDKPRGSLSRFLTSLTLIERHEWAAVLLSFVFVFVLMTAYSVLKPARDALGADWGTVGLAVTWTVNFVLSVIAVTLYGAALSVIRLRVIVPAVYAFFALTFLALYFVTTHVPDPVLANKGFYVWVSVFSLFHLSVFWSFMSDIYAKSQATRLFGFIAAGTSLGGLVGPGLALLLVDSLGQNNLILLSSLMLLVPIPIIGALEKRRFARHDGAPAEGANNPSIGRNPFAGFSLFLTDRFLLAIGAFILLYVTINTFVYFELQDLTGQYGINTRTKIWASIDLATNTLTILTGVLVTGRIVTRLGMPVALSLMPGLVAAGVLLLVAAPTLLVLAVFQVLRRVGNYAITRPSREMLFTVVSREARFKAKPVIDIVLYRGGDMLTAWFFTFVAKGLGLGLAGVAVVIGGIAILWALVAVHLGRAFSRKLPDDAGTVAEAGPA